MKYAKLAAAFAAIMMMTVLAAPAVSAEDSVDLTATVLEPKPEIGIELSATALNFGSLYPGETSSPQHLKVTNIGWKNIDVTASASDDGDEPLFVPGLLIDDNSWTEYTAMLAEDENDDLQLRLHVPEDFDSRGAVGGGITLWAEEKLNIYSTALENSNPGAADAGIPGFVGPDGNGRISTQLLSGAVPTNNYVNPIFTAWASYVVDYWRSDGEEAFDNPAAALGKVTGNNMGVVSLGDLTEDMIAAGDSPGSLILGFDVRIVNGPGPDFAAFENGFISGDGPYVFAELGYVEVSTDGITFARFPSISLTPDGAGGYGALDATKLYNLVGKHVNAYGDSWGTPFDLSDLVNDPAVLNGSVDLNNINYVRIVDIPGSGDYKDSRGNPIYDAWVTTSSGGVDIEALGVINSQTKTFGADFSVDVRDGYVPMTVQFNDRSGGATSWAWDFENDGTVDSTSQNPNHTYAAPGSYTVKLIVSSSDGTDFEIKSDYILARPSAADLTYTNDGTSVTITGYQGSGGDVFIPEEIDGMPVTAIGNSAFRNKALASVTIPDSVTSIGTLAFDGCTALTSVTIGSGLATIGTYAFRGCTALTMFQVDKGNIAFSSVDGVIYNGDGTALVMCPLGKAGSLYIPSGVLTIPASAFKGCTAMTSIELSDSVTTIGNSAFSGCTALTSVNIGNGVISIGSSVFSGCTALSEINVDEGNNAFSSVEGALYNKNVTTLIQCPATRAAMTIPESVMSIGVNALQGCAQLSTVSIPDNVISIGQNAFQGCIALTSVTLGKKLTTIGTQAFSGCTALTGIQVDEDSDSFSSEDGVVYDKAGTTLVLCPPGKTGPFIVSSDVLTINEHAFRGCMALTYVEVPNSVTSMGGNTFRECSSLVSVKIGYGVDSIDSYTFYYCTALESVELPDGLIKIGTNAFMHCTALRSIVIPNSVTTIGSSAFRDCTALTSVSIPNSVTAIGSEAFSGCTALTSMTFEGNAPTTGTSWVSGCINLVVYYHEGATGFTTPTWKGLPCQQL